MKTIEELQKENDELKAHCELLRETLDEAICLLVTALHEPEQITHDDIADYRDVEQSVPKQSLNEIKIKYYELGFEMGWMHRHTDDHVDEESTPEEALSEFYYHAQGDGL